MCNADAVWQARVAGRAGQQLDRAIGLGVDGMPDHRGLQSLFHQKLDRALFASYFIGAVVPLVVLAWLVHSFALPALAERGLATATVIGALCGAGVLVLSGYFATRRIAKSALARMNADNAGLSELLATARTLSKSSHPEEVAAAAARCALTLAGADAALVVSRDEKDEIHVLGSVGLEADALADALKDELGDLAAAAMSDQRATNLSFDRGNGTSTARWITLAVPISANSTEGALVVVRTAAAAAVFGPREIDALDTLCGISAASLDNADLQHSQRNFFSHVTDMLVLALDSHVDGRSSHGARVAELAYRIARELSLDEETIRRVHLAAMLHDLGMLKVPREHHRIPSHFQKHPAIGARMLSRIRLWREAAPIVLHHHEHYDGSGYPGGLVGDAIPIEARIVSVVDAFDAMTREDEQRPARSGSDALNELRNGMTTQFDPEVVRAFLELVQGGEIDT
jgi:putative nucleotidyltransferase with HDIG domain